jgi:uncharacterized membrane protein YgcG
MNTLITALFATSWPAADCEAVPADASGTGSSTGTGSGSGGSSGGGGLQYGTCVVA